jgi:hypothetical protein
MNCDSIEYEILINAVIQVQNIVGFTCEIGVREGGSTQIILDILKQTNQNKIHIAIDPFGNIDYTHWENTIQKIDYTNKMKNKMLMNLYTYCDKNNMEVLYFPLEDTEFFKRFSDGIPIYNENKYIINKYALVFFDGPHSVSAIKTECNFFIERIVEGGIFIFDDINQYEHMEKIHPYILENNFSVLEKGKRKISYVKNIIYKNKK